MSSIEKETTAWLCVYKTLDKLGLNYEQLTCQDPDPNAWDLKRKELHSVVLELYLADTTSTQERADTCLTYARRANTAWLHQYKTPLWSQDMLEAAKPLVKGLAKLKDFHKRYKEGLTAADITVLLATLDKWRRQGRRVSRQVRWGHWDDRLAANVSGAIQFCYANVFRFGDANCAAGEEWDPMERLTRASVSYSTSVPGHPQEMHMDPPKYKCANRHTGHKITGVFEDGPINWPCAVDHLMACDPVAANRTDVTPLFRDTRNIHLDAKAKDGTYVAAGPPLRGPFIRTVIMQLIRENPKWFGTRDPLHFGTHSLRIGAMNDLLDSGADYFTISALGRWASTAVLDYHRMSRDKAHGWHARAIAQAVKTAREKGAGHEAYLESASSSSCLRLRTQRRASAVACTSSGRARVAAARSQTTLVSWSRTGRSLR